MAAARIEPGAGFQQHGIEAFWDASNIFLLSYSKTPRSRARPQVHPRGHHFYITLHCIMLCYVMLYYIILYYIILYYIIIKNIVKKLKLLYVFLKITPPAQILNCRSLMTFLMKDEWSVERQEKVVKFNFLDE